MNHRLRFIHNLTHDFHLTNDRINRRHPFAPRMVGFTPPYRNKGCIGTLQILLLNAKGITPCSFEDYESRLGFAPNIGLKLQISE
jgi:hypothetical protein